MPAFDMLNLFSANVFILYSLKISEKFWFSGYKIGTLARDGLSHIPCRMFVMSSKCQKSV